MSAKKMTFEQQLDRLEEIVAAAGPLGCQLQGVFPVRRSPLSTTQGFSGQRRDGYWSLSSL